MFKSSSIAEVIDFCRTHLSNTQGAPARFALNNCLWEVSINYDELAENPLTEWDHPIGSGIDLSNHRDYRPDAFGEAAPVKVPEFLEWVDQGRPEPEFAWVKVDCRACRTHTTYCLSSDSKPSGCVECGHEQAKYTFVEFCDPDGYYDDFCEFEREYFWEPVYMHDHSGRTISTSPFSCRWDSGCAGIAFIPKSTVGKELTMDTNGLQQAGEKFLRSHVELLDTYLRGDVFYFSIEQGGECIESCGGFCGFEYCLDDCLQSLEGWIGEEVEQEAA